MGQPALKQQNTDEKDVNPSDYQELIDKLKDMPTLPVVAMKVNQLINDPNTTSSEIAALLKQDQVLTAKILRLVNSSYYAVPGGVTDVKKALAIPAGSTRLRSLFCQFPCSRCSRSSVALIYRCRIFGNTRLPWRSSPSSSPRNARCLVQMRCSPAGCFTISVSSHCSRSMKNV